MGKIMLNDIQYGVGGAGGAGGATDAKDVKYGSSNVKQALDQNSNAIAKNTSNIASLNAGFTYSLGNNVDISAYNSSSNKWTAPQDGYVYAYVLNANTNMEVYFDTSMFVITLMGDKAGYPREFATFVRKGVTMWFRPSGGTYYNCYFIPLVKQ